MSGSPSKEHPRTFFGGKQYLVIERQWGVESDKPVFQSKACYFLFSASPSQKIQAEFKNPGEFNVVDSIFSFEYCSFFSNGKNEQPNNLILKRFFVWRYMK